MKNTHPKATKTVYPIICQIVNVIPNQFVAQTAAEHSVVSRTFSPKTAKLHLTFDLGNRLPSFAIVEDAAHHDSVRAAELIAHLKAGDIAVADYSDFPIGHGEKSVIRLLRLGLEMTDEEMLAIRWHMSAFDISDSPEARGNYTAAGDKSPLVTLISCADTLASHLVETRI